MGGTVEQPPQGKNIERSKEIKKDVNLFCVKSGAGRRKIWF